MLCSVYLMKNRGACKMDLPHVLAPYIISVSFILLEAVTIIVKSMDFGIDRLKFNPDSATY